MTTGLVVLAQETVAGNEFAQMLVDGISFGAIYALLAMGFVIIFKATSVINFAHGALTGLGAFLVVAFATVLDFPGRYLTFLPEWAQWTANVLTGLCRRPPCSACSWNASSSGRWWGRRCSPLPS